MILYIIELQSWAGAAACVGAMQGKRLRDYVYLHLKLYTLTIHVFDIVPNISIWHAPVESTKTPRVAPCISSLFCGTSESLGQFAMHVLSIRVEIAKNISYMGHTCDHGCCFQTPRYYNNLHWDSIFPKFGRRHTLLLQALLTLQAPQHFHIYA